MKIVSIILARGGSKGIPRKNLINLKGKPLISHTIETSLNSNVNETWVSTEDTEIKETSEKYGAKVLKRPLKLATDVSQSEDALLHFASNVNFDIMVFIQPTSPLLEAKYINKGLNLIDKYDSIFSAYKEHWSARWDSKLTPLNWDGKNKPRRQDIEETYVENGAFYITTKENLLKSKCRYSGKRGIVEMPINKSFQIDDIEDLYLIEKLI